MRTAGAARRMARPAPGGEAGAGRCRPGSDFRRGAEKQSYEDRVAATQEISSARSLTELVEKQTSFTQHAFEGWAQQAIRISEIYISAAKDIAAPLGQRISSATEEMKSVGR